MSFNEGKINKQEEGPRIIDNDKDFRYSYEDAKDQFSAIRMDLASNLTVEKLQEINSKLPYLPFVQYIKDRKNLVLSPEIAEEEKYKQAILVHDDLIERVKKFKTIAELKQILEEVDEFIREDF